MLSEHRSHMAPAHPPMPHPHPSSTPQPTARCVNLPLPSSGFVDAGHCVRLCHFVSFFFVSFSFSFAHSFHARVSRPHPTRRHPAPPSASPCPSFGITPPLPRRHPALPSASPHPSLGVVRLHRRPGLFVNTVGARCVAAPASDPLSLL